MLARRTEISDMYDQALGTMSEFEVLSIPDGYGWSRYVYPIRINDQSIDRDEFLQALAKADIQGSVYFRPIHTFSWYRALGYRPDQFPESCNQYRRLMAIPCHSALTDGQVEYVIATILRLVSSWP